MLDAVVRRFLLKNGEPFFRCGRGQRLNMRDQTRFAANHRRQLLLHDALWQRVRANGDGNVYMCIAAERPAHRFKLDTGDRLTGADVDLLHLRSLDLDSFETEKRGHAREAILKLHLREPSHNNNVAILSRSHGLREHQAAVNNERRRAENTVPVPSRVL